MKWEEVKLGELYTVHNGLSKSKDFFGSGFPFLSFSTVFKNYFIPEKIIDLVQSSETERKTFSIKKGDVFITRTSETIDELGMSCVALRDIPNATYNGFTKRMRPIDSNKVCPKYIGYFLRTSYFRNKFIAFSNMTTRASLKNEDLLSMTIFLPPYPVQQKIAGILSAYDDLIENNQKQIKLLEEAAQRLYKEWFVDFRFPGHETAKFINGLPEGWRKDTINSQIHLLSGYAFKSSVFNKFGKYKIITIKNVKDGQFDDSNVNHLDAPPDNMPKHCHLKDGDILLSLTGNVGRVCIVVGDGFLMNQRVAKIESTIPAYAYFLFRSDRLFNEINSLANGVAQQNLSPVRTGKIKVCYPSDDILQRFEKIVEPIINRTIALSKKNSILTEARDRLLPKLMNGEIEV